MSERKYVWDFIVHTSIYSANGLNEENRFFEVYSRTAWMGAADRFKEDLIEIFIFSHPPRETIVV